MASKLSLVEYVKKLFTKGPELWEDCKTMHDPELKATIKRDTQRLRRCSLGIVSCDSPEEWYRVCRRECPPGTIITEYAENAEEWEELFKDVNVLVRADLTRSLLTERNSKGAKTLIDVLERRDREHWQKDPKKIEVAATASKDAPEDTGEPKELKVTIVGI